MSGLGGFCPLPIRLGGSSADGLPASQHARISADMSALSRVQPFAWVTWHMGGGDPSLPVIDAYNGMVGVGLAYQPTIVGITDSLFSVTWNAVESDAYEQVEPLAIRHAQASRLSTARGFVTCFWTMGESAVLVGVFDGSGSPGFVATAITLRVT